MLRGLPVDAKVEVDGVEYDLDEVYPDLRIDPTHIIDQLGDHAALYAYWSTLAEEAAILYDVAKRRVDYVEAECDDRLRREARDAEEKVTETVIQRRVIREEKYQDAQDTMLEARRAAALLSIIRRALEQRLSVLIAVNNRDRAELAATGRES